MRKKVSALLSERLHHSSSPQHPVFSAQQGGKRSGGIIRRRNLGFKMELASLPSRSYVTHVKIPLRFSAVSWLEV